MADPFKTTRWSLVLAAAHDPARTQEALEWLCASYWFPRYAFARRRGFDSEDARDLEVAPFELWRATRTPGRSTSPYGSRAGESVLLSHPSDGSGAKGYRPPGTRRRNVASSIDAISATAFQERRGGVDGEGTNSAAATVRRHA